MNRSLILWLDICRLRAGPQDQPYSIQLLVVALVFNTALSIAFLNLVQSGGEFASAAQALLGTAVGLAFCYAALQLRKLPARFVQTVTALFGTNALLTLAAIPAALSLGQAQAEQPPTWAALWLLGVAVWTVAVTGHIFRHALNLPLIGGLGVAILLFMVSMVTGELLS